MTKSELRSVYLLKRQELNENEWAEINNSLLRQITSIPGILDYSYYHVFLGIKKQKEPDTLPLIRWMWEHQKTVCTSSTDIKTNRLMHYQIDSSTQFLTNKWGIPEPINATQADEQCINLVFVPLLVADKAGNRVGYGKGYYDKFLAELSVNPVKIGISSFSIIDSIEDIAAYDVPLDIVVTPDEVITF